MLSEVEMPELSLQIPEEGNKSLREVDMLEWRYVRPEDPPEDYVLWAKDTNLLRPPRGCTCKRCPSIIRHVSVGSPLQSRPDSRRSYHRT